VREDGSDDDDDSYEAQLRRQDREDFDMEVIDAGHEERLRSDAPYRIPTPLLQYGAETPSRGDDFDYNIPSRAPSPVPAWTAPSQAVSRASTPLYLPPEDDLFGDPQTPLFLPERDQTPLFLPGSRGPTPYAFDLHGKTPTFFLTLVGPVRSSTFLILNTTNKDDGMLDSEKARDSAFRGLATASSPARSHTGFSSGKCDLWHLVQY
jgi:hypothetical protein